MNEELFKIPIYDFKIKLVLVNDINEYLTTNNIWTGHGDCDAVVIDFDNDYTVNVNCIVLFSEKAIKSNSIAHEAFHIACLTMKSRGIRLSDESEEAYAYLIDWLVRKLTFTLIKLKQQKNGNTDS